MSHPRETVVVTHHNADLDALASMVAATRIYGGTPLRGRAINPMVQRYLALHKDAFPLVHHQRVDPTNVKRVIVVDVRDGRRLDEYTAMLEHADEVIVWDHHPASPHDIEADEIHVEPAGSCSTLLIERVIQDGVDLTAAEATLLMLGLYSDTGRLSFDTTTPRDVDAAAHLLRSGANLSVVARYLEEEFSAPQRVLLGDLLETTRETSYDAVEIATARASAPRFVRGASNVVQRVMKIMGHDAIFAVMHFTKDKRVQVIGRSRVPYVNVGELLRELGGGGHPGAAAATFKKTTPEEVVTRLEEVLAGTQLRPTRVRDSMTSPALTITHDASLFELDTMLANRRVRGVPVTRDGELFGMISRRDIDAVRDKIDLSMPVSSTMTHEVVTIAPNEPLEDALELMTQKDIGRLPVMHEGRLVGVISRSDIIARLYTPRHHTP